ncbi:MAG: hypothetical protein U9N76_01000 [Candidatus Marinimicrobia bacterium]|nr:hypothetical protein [Candidatus Neomarinimicrobiota bacterium]
MGYFPRPGKYVIKDDDDEKRLNFGKHIHHRKPPRSIWWTIVLLGALLFLYLSLKNII